MEHSAQRMHLLIDGRAIPLFVIHSPIIQRSQNGPEAFAHFRQGVFNTRGNFGIHLARQKTTLLHVPQVCSQHLLRNTGQRFLSSPKRFVPMNRSLKMSTFQRSEISISVVSTGQRGSSLFSTGSSPSRYMEAGPLDDGRSIIIACRDPRQFFIDFMDENLVITFRRYL